MTVSRDTEKQLLQEEPAAWIAGLDEAGRGPLAGPVSIGIAVFDPRFFRQSVPIELQGLTDSKKIPEKKRFHYLNAVLQHAFVATCVHVSSRVVDRLNINGAIEQAMIYAIRRAYRSGIQVNHALLDGNYRFARLGEAFPATRFTSIVKGDQHVFSISAASILAKTRRDRRMQKYDLLFPDYGLADHKGYGTRKHKQAIQKLGPAAIHRRSFKW